MNNIINELLLAGDKFIPQIHLEKPGFTNSTCGPLTRNKTILKSIATGDSWYIYKNGLDKASFQDDMAYGDFKDLPRGTASDEDI